MGEFLILQCYGMGDTSTTTTTTVVVVDDAAAATTTTNSSFSFFTLQIRQKVGNDDV